MKHVEIDRIPLLQHPGQFARHFLWIGNVMRCTPMIEPAHPVFAGHVRAGRLPRMQLGEFLARVTDAEVDHLEQARQRAGLLGAIGGKQQ